MDSHSRSASPREPMRPQHRPPSPPASPGAFDNQAYQHDESDPNHNDSFSSNGTQQQNGHTKEPNGETKTLEAVNLELINLTPKNGNAKKKDVEVDMNTTNPYDEYFVPVNEHRKYMRGEKLYVTQDKRGDKGGCKRPLCWTLLGLVVAAIVAIIVLAATGVLFTNSPTPLEQYNTSVSSARALGGIGHVHHDHDHDHDHNTSTDHDHSAEHDHSADHDHSAEHDHSADHDHSMETTEHQHGPEPQSDEGHETSIISDETADFSMYVPRTVEGEVRIDNEEFSPALEDPESNEYKEFVNNFADGIKRALFDRNSLENGDNEISVEVIQIKKGSVIVTYRIHWKPKVNNEPTEDLLNAKKLEAGLEAYLTRNNRMINVYHIAEEKLATRPVLDICQINKNGCEHDCVFDETTLEFTCTCPYGEILDMANPKRCISLLGTENEKSPEDTKERDFTVLTVNASPVTTKMVPEEENPTTEAVHHSDHTFDWTETHHRMPETTTETETEVNFSHIFGHSTNMVGESDTTKPNSSEENPVPEPEPKPEPEPTPEPKVDPEPIPGPEPKTESEPTPEMESKSEPELNSELEPVAKPEPQPTAEPEPQPAAEPEPQPTAEPEPQPTVEPEPQPTAEPEPQPAAEPEPQPAAEPEPQPAAEPEPQPAAEPEPQPAAEPELLPAAKPELQPTAEPASETTTETEQKYESELKSISEPVAVKKPTSEPEPQPEPEPAPEPEATSTTPSPEYVALNPAFMLREEQQFETTAEPKSEHELTSAPMVEASSETNKQAFTKEISRILENEAGNDPTAITEGPSITTVADNNEQSEHHTDQSDNTEEKSILYTNEGKFEYKPIEDTETQETTTRRISLSEPNLINEPSYEPKPEIISILSERTHENNPAENQSNIDDEIRTTTEVTDWLEQQSLNSAKSVDHNQTEFEELLNNNVNKIMHESEQRSFKTFDEDFLFETTTNARINPVNENDSLDVLSKDSVNPSTEITRTMEKETKVPVSILPDNQETPEGEISNTETTTKIVNTIATVELETSTSETETQNEESSESKTGSMITSILEKVKSLETNKSVPILTTTSEPETIQEYSMNKQYQDSADGEKLLQVLEKKPHAVNIETSTEHEPEEGMDITFDAINMLYNRSSKSIEDKSKTPSNYNSIQFETESTTTGSSTDSDWLSESVTVINYDEAMNKMAKHETTETSITKIDEIMNQGQVKDDFEPDYLSNMGSNSNKQEQQDEPLYGMVQDYDNEDTRYKRVNKEVTTGAAGNVTTNPGDAEKNNSGAIVSTNVSVETTTVSEYIYKVAEKFIKEEHKETEANNSSPMLEAKPSTVSINDLMPEEPTTKAEPAPVWEESDSDKYLTVKELPKKSEEVTTEIQKPVIIDEKPSSTDAPTTMVPMNETTKNITMTGTENSELSANSQNSTQLSNLNVTIYEISSHNGNNTVLLAKPGNAQSAEYDDHETEMNPFLPEVENNKSLVKKLQEGHDLEPNNLTETQNENTEAIIQSEGQNISSTNDPLAVVSKTTETNMPSPTASEDDTLFNELLMNENTTATTTSATLNKTSDNETKVSKPETVPISTFLLDTDDLETITTTTTTVSSNKVDTTSAPVTNSEGVFLSVVPIEEQKKDPLEQHKSENNAELNDISDLPKSDKRTLEATKFDSVITNEA